MNFSQGSRKQPMPSVKPQPSSSQVVLALGSTQVYLISGILLLPPHLTSPHLTPPHLTHITSPHFTPPHLTSHCHPHQYLAHLTPPPRHSHYSHYSHPTSPLAHHVLSIHQLMLSSPLSLIHYLPYLLSPLPLLCPLPSLSLSLFYPLSPLPSSPLFFFTEALRGSGRPILQ